MLPRLPHPKGIDGSLDISAGELLLGDSAFADARVDLALDNGSWTVSQLSAEAQAIWDNDELARVMPVCLDLLDSGEGQKGR